jgi:hypothetical protein
MLKIRVKIHLSPYVWLSLIGLSRNSCLLEILWKNPYTAMQESSKNGLARWDKVIDGWTDVVCTYCFVKCFKCTVFEGSFGKRILRWTDKKIRPFQLDVHLMRFRNYQRSFYVPILATWVSTLCTIADTLRRFGRTYCFHLQGDNYRDRRWNKLENLVYWRGRVQSRVDLPVE